MNRKKLSSKGVAPVIATILVIIIAITLSLVLSTFSSGLFQTLSAAESFDAKVVKVKKVTSGWEIGIFISNTGQRDVTVSTVNVGGGSAETPTWSNTAISTLLKPGQSNLATVTLATGTTGDTADVEILSATGALIFTTVRLP